MLGFRYREVGSDHPITRNFFIQKALPSGSSAAVFQLPSQSAKSGVGFAGHCRLHGRGLKAPVGTPSCKKGNKGLPH